MILIVIRYELIRPMPHYLYLGPTYIGRVDDVFEHQGTYFGEFLLETNREMDDEMERLFRFLDFCRDWFEAQKKSSPPDASHFDDFKDLIANRCWTIMDEFKQQHEIAGVPMFNGGRCGELSWTLARTSDCG